MGRNLVRNSGHWTQAKNGRNGIVISPVPSMQKLTVRLLLLRGRVANVCDDGVPSVKRQRRGGRAPAIAITYKTL